MTDDRQPPSQAVKSYAGGIQARNLQRREERKANPVLPNLGQAAVTYKPTDGPMTIGQIGDVQRTDDAPPVERAPLSQDTVEGLRKLHEAQTHAAKPSVAAAAAPTAEAATKEPAGLDPEDAAFAEALRGVRQDVIQNDAERLAVSKRVKEIDLAEGLLTGEFTQVVPIVPGKLNVRFRCLSTNENNELRLFLYDEVDKDQRKTALAQELLGFYQTVATVVSLNETKFVQHMMPTGPFGGLAFSKESFEQKLATFMSFPLPLIASIATHSAWFEMRVRELFATADALKNG